MNMIDFCRQACRPQETALYAIGGFLSGRCMGVISPMDGAVYMIAIRMAYLVSQKFNKQAYDYLEQKISSTMPQTNPNEPSFLKRLKSNSRCLASSWINLVPKKLPLLKQPMNFVDVYLSYAAGNWTLCALGKQPVGLLAATGIFFSSSVFAVLAGSSIDLVRDKKAAC